MFSLLGGLNFVCFLGSVIGRILVSIRDGFRRVGNILGCIVEGKGTEEGGAENGRRRASGGHKPLGGGSLGLKGGSLPWGSAPSGTKKHCFSCVFVTNQTNLALASRVNFRINLVLH